MKQVSVKTFAEHFNLIHVNKGYTEENKIQTSQLNRMGLQMANFFESFAYERVQLIGRAEWKFFSTLSKEQRVEIADRFMSYDIPCLIVSRGLEIFEELIEAADRHQRPIYQTQMTTTRVINRIIMYLNKELAPSITLHGVLVDLNGVGVLIFGKSGIGKSETALELIKRGHRFVADDAIEISRVDEDGLVGQAPELIKNFIEIRGIGILDIAKIYGIGSVRDTKLINMVVQFDEWKADSQYDRLGLENEYIEILNVKVPKLSIPVKPGRNLAVILEAAARNYRTREMGYNAAEELDRRLMNNNY